MTDALDAMAVEVNPAKLADLASDPLVALIEADQQDQVEGILRGSALFIPP
jgi:hypothetical protein